MDPATHLAIPLLVLLAARMNPRLVVPLSLFALFPDIDSLFGIHRQLFHNVFVTVLIPLAFLLYARARKPSLVLPIAIIMFYLVSHVILDLSGVALLYPFYDGAFYFIPNLYFYTQPGLRFDLVVEWGVRPLQDDYEYLFISEAGFVYFFVLIAVLVIFRTEMKGWISRRIDDAKWVWKKIVGYLRRTKKD
ncbi:MAG: metal-dependent hydrolase [Thermoplasmata archaeon]